MSIHKNGHFLKTGTDQFCNANYFRIELDEKIIASEIKIIIMRPIIFHCFSSKIYENIN